MSEYHRADHGERIVVTVDAQFEEIVERFVEAWKEEIGFMRKALQEEDYAWIGKLGHDMKGMGGSVGFDEITDMGGAIEESAKERDAEVIQGHLDALSSYLERVAVVYE